MFDLDLQKMFNVLIDLFEKAWEENENREFLKMDQHLENRKIPIGKHESSTNG